MPSYPIQTYMGPQLDLAGNFQKGLEIRGILRDQARQKQMEGILARHSDPQDARKELGAAGFLDEASKIQAMGVLDSEAARAASKEARAAEAFREERNKEKARVKMVALNKAVRGFEGLGEAISKETSPEGVEKTWDRYVEAYLPHIMEDPDLAEAINGLTGGNPAYFETYSPEAAEDLGSVVSMGRNVIRTMDLALEDWVPTKDEQGNITGQQNIKTGEVREDPRIATPLTDLGKLTADLKGGLITKEQYKAQAEDTLAGDADIKDEIAVRKEYNSLSDDYFKVQRAHDRIEASVRDPSPAGDLALIFNYMKMLDPGSTVREGEFANAENSAGVPARIRGRYNKVVDGKRLAQEQRDDFASRAKGLMSAAEKSQKLIRDRYTDLAKAYGMDPKNIVSEIPVDEPPKDGIKTVITDEDYEKLDSGEKFIAPDGTTRTKP